MREKGVGLEVFLLVCLVGFVRHDSAVIEKSTSLFAFF